MKKFLLIILLPTLVFASDYKSRFYAGGSISHSKISVSGNGPNGSFCGNGDIHVYGGWEYRLARWFSLSPALGFERNGWSWERAGHEGSVSYFNPYLRLSFDFHVHDFYMNFGGAFGFPFYFGGELDGKNTSDDFPKDFMYSVQLFYSIGYTIKDHYRVGFIQGSEGLLATFHDVLILPIGVYFTYLF